MMDIKAPNAAVVDAKDRSDLLDFQRSRAAAVFAISSVMQRKDSDMAAINRRFYQSSRGPAPSDQDTWSLVFDPDTKRLLVRHAWQTSRHDGFDDIEVAEFLNATGSAQTALIDSLFLVPADA